MSPSNQQTSGNLLADRRFAYAEALSQDGDHAAAADLLQQVVDLVDHWAPAWLALGLAQERIGEADAAATSFAKAAERDRSGRLGADLHAARLERRSPAAISPAYVAALFDQYADGFEVHLVERLHYRGPRLLVAAIEQAAPDRRFQAGLDLGCGTGLMARAIGTRVEAIDGVDLSPAMVAVAAATGLYRTIAVADVVTFLDAAPRCAYDLMLAADVFVYLGDLRPVLASAFNALQPGGFLAFTVQSHAGEGYRFGADLRFGHAEAYVDEILREAGFGVSCLRPASTRHEKGHDVPGLLAVVTRP